MAGALSQKNNERHFHHGGVRAMMDGSSGTHRQSLSVDRTCQEKLSR